MACPGQAVAEWELERPLSTTSRRAAGGEPGPQCPSAARSLALQPQRKKKTVGHGRPRGPGTFPSEVRTLSAVCQWLGSWAAAQGAAAAPAAARGRNGQQPRLSCVLGISPTPRTAASTREISNPQTETVSHTSWLLPCLLAYYFWGVFIPLGYLDCTVPGQTQTH